MGVGVGEVPEGFSPAVWSSASFSNIKLFLLCLKPLSHFSFVINSHILGGFSLFVLGLDFGMEIWGSYFTVNKASDQNTFFGDTLCKEEWDARHRGLSDHSHQSQLCCTERDVHQGNERGLLCGCFIPIKSCVTRRRFVWHLFSAAVKNTQQGLLQALKMFSQDPEETCSERCFSGTQGHLQGLESNLRGNKLLRIRVFNNQERMAYPQRSVGRTRMKKIFEG